MRLCEVASRIDRVTVYRQGAQVTRRADVLLERGEGPVGLVFTGLPLALARQSLRVRLSAESSQGWRAVDIHTDLDVEETSNAEAVERQQLQRRATWLGQLRDRLNGIKLLRRADSAALPVESRLAFLGFQEEVLSDLDERLNAVESRLEALRRRDEYDRPDGIRVTVEVQQGEHNTRATIELDYFIAGPCWAPGYVVRLNDRLDRAALVMQALVAQNTGEDWSGVYLTLTTADAPAIHEPVLRALHEDSELPAWRMPGKPPLHLFGDFDRVLDVPDEVLAPDGLRPSVPPLVYAEETQDRPSRLRPTAAHLDYARLRLPGPSDPARGLVGPTIAQDEHFAQIQKRSTEISRAVAGVTLPDRYRRPRSSDGRHFTYSSGQAGDVASDAMFVPCMVMERQIACIPRYVAVPRKSNDVYRSTEIVNEFSVPLLEGPADLYVDGDYLMTTSLPHMECGGRTRLELGIEPGIEVRRRAHYDEIPGRLLAGARELRHGIRIEVINHLDRRATVEVRERIPVPARERGDIKVTVDRVSPPWARLAPERHELPGRYRWREQVEPDERVMLSIDYTVKVPMRMWLIGGDRRELS